MTKEYHPIPVLARFERRQSIACVAVVRPKMTGGGKCLTVNKLRAHAPFGRTGFIFRRGFFIAVVAREAIRKITRKIKH
ncbi:MAG: hypothetical protein FWE10_04765 [Rikenellaceae bacterium]|nr:hypothetical protein [Rikenellaceae bacterium]MCL2691912.1 hypothetical protein [Rikenellaceae bacterium]